LRKTIQKLLLTIILALNFLLILSPALALEDSKSFIALEDATVYKNNPDINYGGENALKVGYSTNWIESYIKFDLSDAPANFTRVGLRIEIISFEANNSLRVFKTGNGWGEFNITWNDRPSKEIGISGGKITEDGIYVLDLTLGFDYSSTLTLESQYWSICLDSRDNNSIGMASKQCDNKYNPPVLIFYYNVSNIPIFLGGTISTLIIIGFVLALSWNALKIKTQLTKCPKCGNELPRVQNLMFCTKCGTNLDLLKVTKEPSKIATENLVSDKQHKLWETKISIGLPLGASLVMNLVLVGLLILLMFFWANPNVLSELPSISSFVSVITLFSLIFVILPLFYVRRYLEEPTIKNCLIFLGFTTKGLVRKDIAKEILMGIGFAIIGFLVILLMQNSLSLFINFAFNIEIDREISDPTVASLPTDMPSLIFSIITILIIVAPTEEILFRGFMQKGLVRSLGNKRGIIITAFTFSMIHLIGIFLLTYEKPLVFLLAFLATFLPYFSISLILGLIFHWRNENLIAVMVTHGLYNVLTIIYAVILLGLI